jgi:hypothetical protein
MMAAAQGFAPRSFLWANTPIGVSGDAVKIGSILKTASKYGIDYKRRALQDLAADRLGDFLKDVEEDGASEVVISPSAIKEVEMALSTLPGDIPVPNLLDEGNGFVALEWFRNPKNVFLMSFNGTKSVEFASIFGSRNELRGKLEFMDEIPISLIEQLRVFVQTSI